MAKPYLEHLRSSKDLQTSHEAIRAGFVALALEKNRRATPLVAEARALKVAAARARKPTDLLRIDGIQSGLLTAAGVSEKASQHLHEADKRAAIEGLIGNFLEPAGGEFVEELVFRFLLTCGDKLGGSMRNVGGFMAQRKLTRALLACLKLAGMPCQWRRSKTTTWAALPDDDSDVELNLTGLSWSGPTRARTLLYNLTVPIVRNNVDLSLLSCAPKALTRTIMKAPSSYIALGELKGGIDPAGADEHWKTAHTALVRIRSAFAKRKLKPHTFFVGAAIEARMAVDNWGMLRNGMLQNAANLTSDDQIAAVANWLCAL
jgi:hypothetical protein